MDMSGSLVRFVAGLTFVTGALPGLVGCAASDDDDAEKSQGTTGALGTAEAEGTTVCGREVVASPALLPVNPCQDGEVVIDEDVQRTRGTPDETTTFEVEGASELCISIDNRAGVTSDGGDGGAGEGRGRGSGDGSSDDDDRGEGRVSAAWVYVDGELVVGPDEFDQETESLQRTLEVAEGEHEVRVRVASKPGAELGVEVKAANVLQTDGDQPTTTGENGILEVSNVAVDHPMFSPNGDGYHDTALFIADNLPGDLPGEETGDYEYRLEWSWNIIDAETCNRVPAGITGTTRVNSPTNVRALWDGTDGAGAAVDDGQYLYEYSVDLVRSDDRVIDSATATARGMLVDSSSPDVETRDFGGQCDPGVDPAGCRCPEDTPDGVRCTFGWIPFLEDFENPSQVDTSQFITTRNPEGQRPEVVVDLREYNGGGLVPQTEATYRSVEALQSYVAALTGVAPDPDKTRLFNFDYIQLGYSTPVVEKEGVTSGFNHFLLDVITDAKGELTIDGRTVDIGAMLASDQTPVPARFEIDNRRTGDECAYNGNFDGEQTLRARSCSKLRTANLDPAGTNLGVYVLESKVFDIEVDDVGTSRGTHCIVNGIFRCGVRTFHRDADLTSAGVQYIERKADTLLEARDVETRGSETPALVVHTDRTFAEGGVEGPLDGVCARCIASGAAMSTPLDTATGAVSPSCIVNGIF
jgi:hypothetical protein